MPPDDTVDTTSTEVTTTTPTLLPPSKPMPSVTSLTQMVANPNIPGDLMVNTQKELSKISNMTAQIRAAQSRAVKVMEDVLDNEKEAIKSQGAAGINNQYDAKKMLELVTPDQAAIYLDKRNAYERYHDATANWTPDTPYSQMQQDIEKHLGLAGAPVNSPAYATHVKMYEEAQKRALEMEKVRKKQQDDTQEETGRLAEAMMLPDAMRPKGIAPMTDEWLQRNAHNLSSDMIKRSGVWLSAGVDHSDAATRVQLSNDALYKGTDEFRKDLFDAYLGRRISRPDVDHLLDVNKQAQDDAGVKFIKDAMDSKMLGASHIMQAALNSLREKVVQAYLAEKSAHPEWGDHQRMDAAMRLERTNRLVDTNSMDISLIVTPAMRGAGIYTRDDMKRDPVGNLQKIRDYMSARKASGQLTPAEALNEQANYLSWAGYFSYLDNNAAAVKAATEILKRAGEQAPSRAGR